MHKKLKYSIYSKVDLDKIIQIETPLETSINIDDEIDNSIINVKLINANNEIKKIQLFRM